MYRIGLGYDVHQLTRGRKLILAGVEVPHELGLEGHSDADVLTHAVMDSLLGALALGDIGDHFPDADSQYKGADSLVLLKKVWEMIQQRGYRVNNLDGVLIAQRPRLKPFLETMRTNLASCMDCEIELISVKATTTEKMGFAGREEGIAAKSVVLLKKFE